jgi:hypothetical protein
VEKEKRGENMRRFAIILSISIALVLILSSLEYIHPSSFEVVPNAQLPSQPWANVTFAFGSIFYGTVQALWMYIHQQPISTPIQYNGYREVLSPPSNGMQSSTFSDVLTITYHSYTAGIPGYPGIFANVWITTYVNISCSNGTVIPYAYFKNFVNVGGTGASTNMQNRTVQVEILNASSSVIVKALTGIIIITSKIKITPVTTVWGIATPQNSSTVYKTTYQEVYLVSGLASLSVSPSVVQNGGTVTISYSTGGGAFYVQIYGSQNYNGGTIVKNYTVNQWTTSTITYTVPNNAFVNSTNPTGNQWTVMIWNQYIPWSMKKFFTVDNLNKTPPMPSIKIMNGYNTNGYIVGSKITVQVTVYENIYTQTPISYILVNVYQPVAGAEPAPGSSNWIMYNQAIQILPGMNQTTFTFTVPANGTIVIQVQSIDSQGRASNPATVNIYGIPNPPNSSVKVSNTLAILVLIGLISALLIGLAVIFLTGISLIDKIIISLGFSVGMVIMILYYAIANGILGGL